MKRYSDEELKKLWELWWPEEPNFLTWLNKNTNASYEEKLEKLNQCYDEVLKK